jgi:hypothetical protein
MFFKKRKEDERKKILRYHKQIALQELEDAKRELSVAEYHFNNCETLFFEVANEQLTVAKNKVNIAIMKSKLINQAQ